MPHKQPRSARQYARPGCCYEMPVVINDDEQMAPTKTKTRPISAHTATWLEAKASGRWQAPPGTTTEPTFVKMATCLEDNARGKLRSSVNKPAIQAEPAQRCRKRALPDAGEDSDKTKDDAKRLRLSGTGFAGGNGDLNQHQHIPHIHPGPFRANNYSDLIRVGEKSPANGLAELKTSVRTMQRNIDLERATVRDIQWAEEQTELQEERKRAREAERQNQEYRSTFQLNLHKMRQDCDRDREAAEERRNNRECEEREEAKRKECEAERQRLNELSNIEANLRSMWEAHDLERGMPPKIRPGQLSEAGQRRVRERAERLQRHK